MVRLLAYNELIFWPVALPSSFFVAVDTRKLKIGMVQIKVELTKTIGRAFVTTTRLVEGSDTIL